MINDLDKLRSGTLTPLLAALILYSPIALSGCERVPRRSVAKAKAGRKALPDDGQTVETVKVQSLQLSRNAKIQAELLPFRDVAIRARVQGFVEKIYVDRGAHVAKGDRLADISAPEIEANYQESLSKCAAARVSLQESRSKIEGLSADLEEEQAKRRKAEVNLGRIREAAKTEGAIAPVDIENAESELAAAGARVRSATLAVEAARSRLLSDQEGLHASEQGLKALEELKGYLHIRAPFSGIVTERNVHEGCLVGGNSGNLALLRLQQVSPLRLTVPVPESLVAGLKEGVAMKCSVPAHVGQTFQGTVSRIGHSLDPRSRTMIVELDVPNPGNELEPGMCAEVSWLMQRPSKTLFVPASAVFNEEDQSYILGVYHGRTRKLSVVRGLTMGSMVEVVGPIARGDEVVLNPQTSAPNSLVRTHLIEPPPLPLTASDEH
ncbi:MAG: efflux RND transporter periplasmic adaptor subunit [Candidatus Obscuribacter sp.]|nr:efflux RND transporter periplasmic adaptor subunit [Candidatus Obscuribacter sp.]